MFLMFMMAVFGQQVTWYADDGPTCSYRLRLDDAGTVVAEKIFVLEGDERVFRWWSSLSTCILLFQVADSRVAKHSGRKPFWQNRVLGRTGFMSTSMSLCGAKLVNY